MIIQKIPMAQWAEFLDTFARAHRGRQVCLEKFDQPVESGAEPTVSLIDHRASGRQVRLYRIDYNDGDLPDAVVSVSHPKDPDALEHHLVMGLRGVRLEQPEADQGGTLRLDARTPAVTLIRFPQPVIPGHPDGIAPQEI